MMKGKSYMIIGLAITAIIVATLIIVVNQGQFQKIVQGGQNSEQNNSIKSSQGSGESSTYNPLTLDEITRLVNRNGDLSDPSTPRPLLTLEEFFDGNQDPGSIGYNLYPDQPSPQEFYKVFKAIRANPAVNDVRVEVSDQVDENSWPSTDTIWIITSADRDEVVRWIPDDMKPDDVINGFPTEIKIEPYDIPAGMHAFGIWWD